MHPVTASLITSSSSTTMQAPKGKEDTKRLRLQHLNTNTAGAGGSAEATLVPTGTIDALVPSDPPHPNALDPAQVRSERKSQRRVSDTPPSGTRASSQSDKGQSGEWAVNRKPKASIAQVNFFSRKDWKHAWRKRINRGCTACRLDATRSGYKSAPDRTTGRRRKHRLSQVPARGRMTGRYPCSRLSSTH